MSGECYLSVPPSAEDEDLDFFIPCCMGSAVYGPSRCTCWRPIYDKAQQTPTPGDFEVQVRMCHDCAYRPGSPERSDQFEEEELLGLVYGDNPFWCHQGMRRVIEWRHPDGRVRAAAPGDYQPGMEGTSPRPYRADGRPALICGGWALLRSKALTELEANA